MIEGVPEAELLEFKKAEITEKVRDSIQEKGNNPDPLAGIILAALNLLKKMIRILMDREEENVPEPGVLKEEKPTTQMKEPDVP